jgi:hypothetical protein
VGSASRRFNESLARREVARLMSLVEVGPRWTAIGGPRDGRLASVVGPAPASSPTLVQRTRYWVVPGDPQAVLAEMKAYPPQGLVAAGWSGGSGGSGPAIDQVWFRPVSAPAEDPHWHRLAGELLSETVTVDPAGGTDLRVDAEVTWLPSRTPAQTIPSSVTSVKIAVTSADTGRRRLSATTVTDPKVIAKLRTDVNDMIPIVPGARGEGLCVSGADPIWHVQFRDPHGRTWLVTSTRPTTGEQSVLSTGSERVGPTLATGEAFTELLARLTHLPPNDC